MNKLFANPKTRLRNLLLIILPFALLIVAFSFFGYKSITDLIKPTEEKSNKIESMNYVLRANATEYQKELFQELKDTFDEQNDLKTAELIVKNYVADFYTWSNKAGSYDVGGAYYVYSPEHKSIVLDAKDHFYKYVSYYINKYGKENLIEVNNVKINNSSIITDYCIENEKYDAFYIECSWTYKDCVLFEEYEFATCACFRVIKNKDGRFEIAEVCYYA